jgi:prefoldin subunit 5
MSLEEIIQELKKLEEKLASMDVASEANSTNAQEVIDELIKLQITASTLSKDDRLKLVAPMEEFTQIVKLRYERLKQEMEKVQTALSEKSSRVSGIKAYAQLQQ